MGESREALIIDNLKHWSLRDIAAPLFRRKKLITTVFVILFAILLIVGLVIVPPPYRARMELLVNGRRFDPVVTGEQTNAVPVNNTDVTIAELNSEVALLTSHDILRNVVTATKFTATPGLYDMLFNRHEEQKEELAIRKLAKKIKAENVLNTNLIDVSVSDSDPQTSYTLLKALSESYLAKHSSLNYHPESQAFFSNEAEKYRVLLEDAEKKLKDFSAQPNGADPAEVRTGVAEQLTTKIGQLHLAEEMEKADEERLRSDKRILKELPSRINTAQQAAPADKLLQDLHLALVTAQAKRAQLVSKYDAQYPLVREVDDEIAQVKSEIALAEKSVYTTVTTDRDPMWELVREDLAKTEADMATQNATVKASRVSVSDLQKEIEDLDQKNITLADLQREVKTNEDNYLLYVGKREQQRISAELDKTAISNVALASPPAWPTLPLYSPLVAVLAAFGAALFISLVVGYAADYWTNTYVNPDQIVEDLNVRGAFSFSCHES